MKKTVIFGFVLLFTALSSSAQTHVKIGYTDPSYIMGLMPESKQVETELQSYEKQLQSQLQNKYTEYQQKLETYQRGQATMPDIVKQDKEKELMGMQQSIKEFEEKAQGDMQKKQVSLLEPVLDKIQKAIDAVAEENGFTYIFSTHTDYGSSAVILYAKNKNENISDLVLKKLGITPPATTPGGTGTGAKTGVAPKAGAPIK